MSRTLMIVLGVTAASVFGLALYMLGGSPEAGTDAARLPSASADAPTVEDDDRERGGGGFAQPRQLSNRVAKLEAEVKELRRELKLVRASAGMGRRRSADGVDAEEPAFEGSVREIIEADREEEREKEMEHRKERWDTMTTEILAELREQAGISETQSDEIAGLWKTESEQTFPIFTEARAGERPFAEARADVEKLRAQTDKTVAELLSEEQFEKYSELRPAGRRGGRGGRRGPPR